MIADYFLSTVPHKIQRKVIKKFRNHKLGKIGVFEAKELFSLKHLGNKKNTSFRSLENLTKKPTCPLDTKKVRHSKIFTIKLLNRYTKI